MATFNQRRERLALISASIQGRPIARQEGAERLEVEQLLLLLSLNANMLADELALLSLRELNQNPVCHWNLLMETAPPGETLSNMAESVSPVMYEGTIREGEGVMSRFSQILKL